MVDDGTVAGRLRRPSWTDPRLLVGVLLMVIAIVGVAFALDAADHTEPYYVAAGTLVPGAVLSEGDLEVSHVRVPHGAYLGAQQEPPWGSVVTRVVGQGELVPVAALTDADSHDGRVLGVVATSPVAPDLGAGSAVDLWVTATDDTGAPQTFVVEDLAVADVDRAERAFAVAGGETVYLAVPSDSVATVLDALSWDGDVTIVGRSGS
ncbi:hypothetical protein [Demequina sp.]|uniref:hypothetical protein n=1 Tax=Demequina sp. TaxID=2050685 RepID=UPI003A89D5E8